MELVVANEGLPLATNRGDAAPGKFVPDELSSGIFENHDQGRHSSLALDAVVFDSRGPSCLHADADKGFWRDVVILNEGDARVARGELRVARLRLRLAQMP